MMPEAWRRIEAIVEGALEQGPADRPAYLDQACEGDETLRLEVESLLAFDGQAEHVVAGAIRGCGTGLLANLGFAEGDYIGVYRVIREIGCGGMGTVYLAERSDEFHKKVAIKLVTRGMDTAALLERFRHERQILARLEHPYIARLLDGGSTEDGRPYLVMEYVEGKPITRYCADQRLNPRQRIELFRKVCAAVQSAHQSLVVHRDLKPGNILVDADGSPKLLDFGIAKMLGVQDAPQFTIAAGGMQMLTPDYASPEQVRGEAITTAADVYALGAILYELVTGVRPHRLENYTPLEIERAVCTRELAKPSAASRQSAAPLKAGDLDNIILMAMQKEPARRYSSVAEFSEDLQAFLDGLPVRAREDTVTYRARKFVRRHRMSVAAAVLLVATLAGGVTVSTIQARRAQRRFNEVRRIAHAVLYDIHDAIRDLQGSTKARELIVKTALEYLDGLSREAAGDPGIQLELAEAYERIGSVQGDESRSLGMTVDALQSYRRAVRIADDLAARDPDSVKANLIRVQVRGHIANILARRGSIDQALGMFQEGEKIGEAIALRESANVENLGVLSTLYGTHATKQNDHAQAIALARKCVVIRERLTADQPASEEARVELANAYSLLEYAYSSAGRHDEALDTTQRAARIYEELVAAHPLNARYRRNLAVLYSQVADAFVATTSKPERAAAALEYQRKALDLAARLAAADPADQRAAFVHAMMLWKAEVAMPQDTEHEQALALLRQATVIFQRLVAAEPGDAKLPRNLASVYALTGIRLSHAGDASGAVQSLGEAIRICEELVAKDAKDLTAVRYLWKSHLQAAQILAHKRKRDEALAAARKCTNAAQAAGTIDRSNDTLVMLPQSYASAGAVQAILAAAPDAPAAQVREDWRQARDSYQKAVEAWEQIPEQHIGSIDRDAELAKARAETARCAAVLARIH